MDVFLGAHGDYYGMLAKHETLQTNGARIKNTTGKHLLQGPITVLEAGSYAGDAQIDALIPLLSEIKARYHVNRGNIVGHSDIAPTRKQDPGELFPWGRLARHRLALPGGGVDEPQTALFFGHQRQLRQQLAAARQDH